MAPSTGWLNRRSPPSRPRTECSSQARAKKGLACVELGDQGLHRGVREVMAEVDAELGEHALGPRLPIGDEVAGAGLEEYEAQEIAAAAAPEPALEKLRGAPFQACASQRWSST